MRRIRSAPMSRSARRAGGLSGAFAFAILCLFVVVPRSIRAEFTPTASTTTVTRATRAHPLSGLGFQSRANCCAFALLFPPHPFRKNMEAVAALSKTTTRSAIRYNEARRRLASSYRSSSVAQKGTAENAAEQSESLTEKAARLRREAEQLESELRGARAESAVTAAADKTTQPVVTASYRDLKDSRWLLTYRFSSEPEPPAEEDNNGDSNDGGATETLRRKFYSGKVGIHLLPDGYTEVINDEGVTDLRFTKVWGWDGEISSEDGLRYLLFSADVELPEDDPMLRRDKNNASAVQRFYFQARVETVGGKKELQLEDGKVTVKRNIENKVFGWSSLFRTDGILAQFRDVGDFRCRPVPPPSASE